MNQSKKPVFLIKKYKDILLAVITIEVATFLVSCADTLIAGNIVGEDALAAVGVVAPFMILVTFFSSIVNSGTMLKYSYNIGSCNIEKAQKIFSQGIIMAVFAGIAIFTGMRAGENFFLESISADVKVMEYISDYYGIIIFYLCLDPLSCLLDNTMVAEGGEKVSAITNIIEIVGNFVLSIVLAFKYGVTGIAAASVIFKIIFLIISVAWIFITKNNIAFVWYIDFKECRTILSTGMVKASTFVFSAFMIIELNYYVMNTYEDEIFVLLVVAERILGLSTFFLGLCMALQPVIETVQGEKDNYALHALIVETCKIMITIGLTLSFFIVVFSPLLIQIFQVNNELILTEGIDALRLIGATMAFQALSTLLFVYCYFIEKRKLALWVCALKDFIIPFCMSVVGSILTGNSYGIWIGLSISPVLTILFSMATVYFIYGKNNFPFLIPPEENKRNYYYDFELTVDNAVSLSKTVVELLNKNYGNRLSILVGTLVEDILILIKSKNPDNVPVHGECNVILEEKQVTLIIRYNGVLFDITDCDSELKSLRQYVVSNILGIPDFKTYLVTTGYNRSILSFKI